MTSDEWEGCAHLIENCFKGDWDDQKAESYLSMLQGFDPVEVVHALQRMTERRQVFIPAVGEIVDEIRKGQEPPLPSWAEAWGLIYQSLTKGSEERGNDFLNARYPLLAAFVRAEGWKRLSQTPFDDPQYGGLRIKELEGRWDQFVETAKDRVIAGRALEARTGSSKGLPTRLSYAAVLPPPPKEIEGAS